MRTQAGLASTEARVFSAYWQDGLLDLLAGSALVAIGLCWVAGFVLAVVIVPPVVLVTWPILRQRVTDPRLGQVRFNAGRRHRMRHGLIAVASLGVLLFGFVGIRVLKGGTSELVRWLAPGIPALLLAALALSAAEALRLVRFVGYAAVFVTAGLVVAALDADPGWAIAVAGAIVLGNGARMLRRFLREFPRLPAEMDR